jgi:hypothetical protein
MIYDKYKREHFLIMSVTAINVILSLIIININFNIYHEPYWLVVYIKTNYNYNLFIGSYIICICFWVLYLREIIRSIRWLYIVCLGSILLCTILICIMQFYDNSGFWRHASP